MLYLRTYIIFYIFYFPNYLHKTTNIVYHNITYIFLIIRFLVSILGERLPTSPTLKMQGSGCSEILVPIYEIKWYSYVLHIRTHRHLKLCIAQYLYYR